jgi:uncharacterized protein (DUF1800 family)
MAETFSRRDALRIGLLAGSVSALAGCSEVSRNISPSGAALKRPSGSVKDEVRLSNRLAFGPRGDDLEQIREMGAANWIQKQLAADQQDDPRLMLQLRRTSAIQYEGGELRDLPDYEVIRHLQQASILRAVYSPNQLQERMVDFWSNHFNLYGRKWPVAYSIPEDSRKVIRQHALGKFEDMLLASAKSPAMLQYLDNQFNKRGVPNENYAREILELHTLGVDGGYTQRDVMELARCFTGWGLESGFLKRRGTFVFDESKHDNGSKTVLGHRIPSGMGVKDGEIMIHLLSQDPRTANFLSRKLCRYFLGEESMADVAGGEQAYLASQGNIRATLQALLTPRAVLESPPVFKRPLDFAVSALRATGAQTDAGPGLLKRMYDMGQPLYEWPMPDGYPDETQAWTGGMLARWNFAIDLVQHRIDGTRIPTLKAEETGLQWVSTEIRDVPEKSELGLYLMAPAFQWK